MCYSYPIKNASRRIPINNIGKTIMVPTFAPITMATTFKTSLTTPAVKSQRGPTTTELDKYKNFWGNKNQQEASPTPDRGKQPPSQDNTKTVDSEVGRKLVYLKTPYRPVASMIPEDGQKSRTHHIITSQRNIPPKPLYVMDGILPTMASSKPGKEEQTTTKHQQEQTTKIFIKTELVNSALAPEIFHKSDPNPPQVLSNQIPIIEMDQKSSIKKERMQQTAKAWIPINNISKTLEPPSVLDAKPEQYITPKLLRHPSKRQFSPITIKGNITRFGPHGEAQNIKKSTSERYIPEHIINNNDLAKEDTNQGDQINSKDSQWQAVLTMQQMQRNTFKNLFTFPQEKVPIGATEYSNTVVGEMTDANMATVVKDTENDENYNKINFHVPCARSARNNLIMGFRFCV